MNSELTQASLCVSSARPQAHQRNLRCLIPTKAKKLRHALGQLNGAIRHADLCASGAPPIDHQRKRR